VVARFGELILLGTPWGQPRTPVNFTHFVSRAHEKSIRIIGAHTTTSPQRDGTAGPRVPVRHSAEGNIRYILDLMRAEHGGPRLRIAPLRTHVLPAAEAQIAYDGLHSQPDRFLGVALRWNG